MAEISISHQSAKCPNYYYRGLIKNSCVLKQELAPIDLASTNLEGLFF